MALATGKYPIGVRPDLWGPALVHGAKFYVFQGQQNPIPAEWTFDVNRFLKELKHTEKLQWIYSLPHERDALLNKKLIAITKDLPHDWTMIIGTTICGAFLLIQVVSFAKSKL